MKIIILGAGQVGTSVAQSLVSEANDITVVDENPLLLDNLQDRLDIKTVCGFASHPSVLIRAGIDDAEGRSARFQRPDPSVAVPFLLGKKGFAVGDDQPHIADAGLIDPRIIHLVEDPVAERKPHPAGGTQCRSHATFSAGGPSSGDARSARSEMILRFIHKDSRYLRF